MCSLSELEKDQLVKNYVGIKFLLRRWLHAQFQQINYITLHKPFVGMHKEPELHEAVAL